MEIDVEEKNGIAVAILQADDLDSSNVAEFKREIAPVVDNYSKVILNLIHVRFVDSSGLGALISCLRQLTAKGGVLKLCCMSKSVQATFELVRMNRILDNFSTQEEALQNFGS